MPLPSEAAPPLEWHPWYRNKTSLLDWLNHRGRYADTNPLRIPVPVFALDGDDLEVHEIALTRHRAAGRAPYVGCPFHYTWTVGVDSLGRQIASDSTRHYPWHDPRSCTGHCMSQEEA